MLDTTIHLGDVLVMLGFLGGGWKIASAFRDDVRNLKTTVYGSKEPPVTGLVQRVTRLEDAR